jgi:SAM-dependent methyltransferase
VASSGTDGSDYGYHPDVLGVMVAAARRQHAKDALFLEGLVRFLVPSTVLEIGAGCGQLSALLAARGWDVTASDVESFFVDYMAAQGLKAVVLDATNLGAGISKPLDNVLAQSISPLITRDLEVVERTYRSIHSVLKPAGRFVFILPAGRQWSNASDHLLIAERAGFDLVHRFRHQALPSAWYGRLPRFLLRASDSSIGRVLGVRWVFVFAARSWSGPGHAGSTAGIT